jgi:hypothetical protein
MQGRRPHGGGPQFAHGVEQALADVFDEHGIRWDYEPHTFVLAQSPDGTVRRAFTPDFYLPDLELYVECTVARRAHTTRKRSKARDARARYGITVEIVYRSDLEHLARRWSLGELERALGQCGGPPARPPGPSHTAAVPEAPAPQTSPRRAHPWVTTGENRV